jgi:hypothetical protein
MQLAQLLHTTRTTLLLGCLQQLSHCSSAKLCCRQPAQQLCAATTTNLYTCFEQTQNLPAGDTSGTRQSAEMQHTLPAAILCNCQHELLYICVIRVLRS